MRVVSCLIISVKKPSAIALPLRSRCLYIGFVEDALGNEPCTSQYVWHSFGFHMLFVDGGDSVGQKVQGKLNVFGYEHEKTLEFSVAPSDRRDVFTLLLLMRRSKNKSFAT